MSKSITRRTASCDFVS